MALWFVTNATSPFIVIASDISIVIVYDKFMPKPFGKKTFKKSMGNETDKLSPSSVTLVPYYVNK